MPVSDSPFLHPEPTTRSVEFGTADGVELLGDLVVPDEPVGAAIICHPHPQYGGNRFDHVVGSLFGALPTIGVAALRFDFRRAFDGGVGERLDAMAALDELGREVPGVPLVAAGYSFGAIIAAAVDDRRVSAAVLVAPPLAIAEPTRGRDVPTLVVTPAHDQFSPPTATQIVLDEWSRGGTASIDHETIDMADHFLHGATDRVAALATTFLTRNLGQYER